MEKLTNIIEAVLFASGSEIALKELSDKLNADIADIKESVEDLKLKYPPDSGIQLLTFNGKVQLSTNPIYKDEVAVVLNPIKEKEFTRAILESAAIIAYKQPVTRTEIEMIRGVNSDYAIRTLLELDMIVPCGRKDTIGKPILYATTDKFLKRFRLNSLDELPDYDELMDRVAKESVSADNYLYSKDTYTETDEVEEVKSKIKSENKNEQFEVPDFLKDMDESDLIKIE